MHVNPWTVVRLEAEMLVARAVGGWSEKNRYDKCQAGDKGGVNSLLAIHYGSASMLGAFESTTRTYHLLIEAVFQSIRACHIADPSLKDRVRLFEVDDTRDMISGLCPCGQQIEQHRSWAPWGDMDQEPTHFSHACGRVFHISTGIQTAHHNPTPALVS